MPPVEHAQRVLGEAEALRRLDHVHVCRYYASWETGPLEPPAACILMEWATGGNFADLLRDRWRRAKEVAERDLPETEVMDWFAQLAAGLAHVHACRVIHRDLKPENIFVAEGGPGSGRRILKVHY